MTRSCDTREGGREGNRSGRFPGEQGRPPWFHQRNPNGVGSGPGDCGAIKAGRRVGGQVSDRLGRLSGLPEAVEGGRLIGRAVDGARYGMLLGGYEQGGGD